MQFLLLVIYPTLTEMPLYSIRKALPMLRDPLTWENTYVFFDRHKVYSYAVVLLMSCTLCSGSMVSGQRRIQGAKTIAKALADIRFVSSCRAILKA